MIAGAHVPMQKRFVIFIYTFTNRSTKRSIFKCLLPIACIGSQQFLIHKSQSQKLHVRTCPKTALKYALIYMYIINQLVSSRHSV